MLCLNIFFLCSKKHTKLCSFFQLWRWNNSSSLANCTKTNILLANMKEFFNGKLKLPSLTLHIPQFPFSDVNQDIFLVSNHSLLLFKDFICISKDSNILLLSRFFWNLQKVHTIEQKISQQSEKKKKDNSQEMTKNSK